MQPGADHLDGVGPPASVFVVVLSWNGWELLDCCLESLRRQTYSNRTILVVDNGSRDRTLENVRRLYPEALLIENGENLGFSAGNNVGIRSALMAGADYVVLLNQDTEVDPTWLSELVDVAEREASIGAVASRMYFHTHRSILNSTGIVLNLAGMGWDREFGRVDQALFSEPDEVLGVTGGAMFLRATALRQVGLLDPDYFAYYEDLDLCVRLREAGYRLVYAPRAMLRHRFSTALKDNPARREILQLSNRWRFVLKHYSISDLFRHGLVIVAHEIRFLLWAFRSARFALVSLRFRSYFRTVRGGASVLRYRWRRYRGGRPNRDWWRFVIRTYHSPRLFFPTLDYQLVDDAAKARTDRILMGVNDTVLGEGWYPRSSMPHADTRHGIGPAYREFGKTATCYLRVRQPGNYHLQLQVCHPFSVLAQSRLRVFVDNVEIGDTTIDTFRGEWRTVRFPVIMNETTATVRLLVDCPLETERSGLDRDLGLRVNEVSLVSLDSPFSREDLGTVRNGDLAAVTTTLMPASLRAGYSICGKPRRVSNTVEFTLSVENQGDTLWLTPEMSGLRGSVFAGVFLFDARGRNLGEVGPRRRLDRPLFPGERQNVSLIVGVPEKVIGGRLMIDLVVEGITWFAHKGSTPFYVELPTTTPPGGH